MPNDLNECPVCQGYGWISEHDAVLIDLPWNEDNDVFIFCPVCDGIGVLPDTIRASLVDQS